MKFKDKLKLLKQISKKSVKEKRLALSSHDIIRILESDKFTDMERIRIITSNPKKFTKADIIEVISEMTDGKGNLFIPYYKENMPILKLFDKEKDKAYIKEVISELDGKELLFVSDMSILELFDKEKDKEYIKEVISELDGEEKEYLFKADDKGNMPILKLGFDKNEIIEVISESLGDNQIQKYLDDNEAEYDRIIEILKLNPSAISSIDPNFVLSGKMKEFSNEALLRITCDRDIQSKISKSNANVIDSNTVNYIMQYSNNFIITLDDFLTKKDNLNSKFGFDLSKIDASNIDEKFIENYLLAVKDGFTGISINNIDDIRNYSQTKKQYLMDIMQNSVTSAIEKKEALMQYTFGISLEEAKRLQTRYGAKLDNMPPTEEIRNLKILKSIIDTDPEVANHLIYNAAQKGRISEPLTIKEQLNLEGNFIEQYQNLFNQKLINVDDRDAKVSRREVEYDLEGEKKQIPVYTLDGDFKLDIRVEGAYSYFDYQKNYNYYYGDPHINYTHGNCESLISNDLIAPARYYKDRHLLVGYKSINGSLNGLSSTDIGSNGDNKKFSSFHMSSIYMTPQDIIDNTRHTHNELVEDKICMGKDGKVEYRKPDYAVWLIDEPIQERENADGSPKNAYIEKLKMDSNYNETKKLAAQLGIPIVVIDRERIAIREETRIKAMKKILQGKPLDKKEQEFYEEYENMPEPKLVKEIITKFENNANGLRFLTGEGQIGRKYFTDEKRKQNLETMEKIIDEMPEETKKECKKALEYAVLEEKTKSEMEIYQDITYSDQQHRDEQEKKRENERQKAGNILQTYLTSGLNIDDYKNAQQSIKSIQEKGKAFKLYPDNETVDIINQISGTDYYEGNTVHSIEHIQKVILFSDILAKGENLREEDRKLLLMAAAFHDSGRKLVGSDGNNEHAKPSAIFAGKVLSSTKKFGNFTDHEISIIQTAIAYHEFNENPAGELNEEAIKKLGEEYKLQPQDLRTAERVSMLLKDADALDRFRFAKRGRLQEKYLHSDTAKQKSTIEFAKEINEDVSREVLKEIYGEDEQHIQQGEREGKSTTLQLREAREKMKSQKQVEKYVEKHVGVGNIIQIFMKKKEKEEPQKENKAQKIEEQSILEKKEKVHTPPLCLDSAIEVSKHQVTSQDIKKMSQRLMETISKNNKTKSNEIERESK